MEIRFSVHALDRFADLVSAVDVGAVWTRLAASLERAARAVAAIRADRYVVRAHGLDFLIVDGVVVSVRTPPKR